MRLPTVITSSCLLFMSLLLTTAPFARADTISQAPAKPVAIPSSERLIEKIEVRGRTPLLFYKRQFEMAELDFYDLVNALVDDEDYKMRCSKRRMVGSNIKRTECYPQYFLNRLSQESADAFSSTDPADLSSGIVRNVPGVGYVDFIVQEEREKSLAYIEKLVSENPALRQQLIKMHAAKLLYEYKKAEAQN